MIVEVPRITHPPVCMLVETRELFTLGYADMGLSVSGQDKRRAFYAGIHGYGAFTLHALLFSQALYVMLVQTAEHLLLWGTT